MNLEKTVTIKHPLFINPYFGYVFFWLLALIGYAISPSSLCQPLDKRLLTFIIVTVAIAIVPMILFNIRRKNQTFSLKNNKHVATTIILGLLYVAEFLYSKYVPLFAMGSGYKDFGIPTVHVIITTFSTFYCVYRGFLFFHFKGKENLLGFLVPLAFFVLCFSRGMLACVLVLLVCLFLIDKKIKFRYVFFIAILGVAGAWLFGILGNIRSGLAWNDSGYILQISGIKGDRYSLLSPFYWVEEYIICSLRNLNLNVLAGTNGNSSGLFFSILPDFIAKRIIDPSTLGTYEIVAGYTTGTSYIIPFLSLGFTGMTILYVSYMVICLLIDYIKFDMQFKIICLAFLLFLFALSIFDNMLFYSGYSFSIVFAIIYAAIKRNKQNTIVNYGRASN